MEDVGIGVGLRLCFAAAILSSATAHGAEQQAELAPSELVTSELACEYATNPLGVDTPRPRFGWLLESDRRSQSQSAYRVLVATSEKQLHANVGNKWDSGKVNSDRSVNVEYRGKPLSSEERCYWKVRVWDGKDRPSGWSAVATWEMGLLERGDWVGQWIGSQIVGGPRTTVPAPYLRRAFDVGPDDGQPLALRLGVKRLRKTVDERLSGGHPESVQRAGHPDGDALFDAIHTIDRPKIGRTIAAEMQRQQKHELGVGRSGDQGE